MEPFSKPWEVRTQGMHHPALTRATVTLTNEIIYLVPNRQSHSCLQANVDAKNLARRFTRKEADGWPTFVKHLFLRKHQTDLN